MCFVPFLYLDVLLLYLSQNLGYKVQSTVQVQVQVQVYTSVTYDENVWAPPAPKSPKKRKVLGFTLQFFSSPASPGPKKILSRLFSAILVPSSPASAD